MKVIRSTSKSGAFLLELIIAVLIFAVASAVCVQMFAKAHLISSKSEDVGEAMLLAQNFAELYKAVDPETLAEMAGEGVQYYYCSYDLRGDLYIDQMESEYAVYLLKANYRSERKPLLAVDIWVYPYADQPTPRAADLPIYTLEVVRYQGLSGDSDVA